MEFFALGYCFQDLVRVPVQIEWIFMKILLTNLPDQICHISPTLNIQTKWIYSAIYSVTRFEVELECLEGMDHIISSEILLQRLLEYNSAASTLTTCNIYQSGTFGAPEFWCLSRTLVPPLFWGSFFLITSLVVLAML